MKDKVTNCEIQKNIFHKIITLQRLKQTYSGADLIPTLPSLNMNNLPHFKKYVTDDKSRMSRLRRLSDSKQRSRVHLLLTAGSANCIA